MNFIDLLQNIGWMELIKCFITGFGYNLAKGAIKDVTEKGIIGAFTGGVTASSGGIAAAIFFGYIASLIAKPKMKKE